MRSLSRIRTNLRAISLHRDCSIFVSRRRANQLLRVRKNRASAREPPPVPRNFNQDALDRIDVTPVLALHQCYRKQQGNPFRIRSKLSIAITLVRSATSERRHVMDQ